MIIATAPPSALQSVRDRLVGHLVASVERATPFTSPFCHFSVARPFPDDVYAEMLDALPPLSSYRPDNPKKYGRADGTSARNVLPLAPDALAVLDAPRRILWTAVSEALADASVRQVVLRKLGRDLRRRFRVDETALERMTLYPRASLVCDLGGYYIEPHPDSRAKAVTMQFYLTRDEAQRDLGTALYRLRLLNWRALVRPAAAMEKVKQFDFAPNSGYGFAVSWKSFHGREPVPGRAGPRHTLMHVYYRVPDRMW